MNRWAHLQSSITQPERGWHHATPSNKGERRVERTESPSEAEEDEHMTSLGDGSNSAYLYQKTASQHSKAPYGYQKGAVVGKGNERVEMNTHACLYEIINKNPLQDKDPCPTLHHKLDAKRTQKRPCTRLCTRESCCCTRDTKKQTRSTALGVASTPTRNAKCRDESCSFRPRRPGRRHAPEA